MCAPGEGKGVSPLCATNSPVTHEAIDEKKKEVRKATLIIFSDAYGEFRSVRLRVITYSNLYAATSSHNYVY